MKLKEIMSGSVIQINLEETVAVAARTLARHNIGALPVCDTHGNLCGVVTDRDLVTRCIAAGRNPDRTKVRDVMTTNVVSARPDLDTAAAARLMGRQQIRRLPVVDEGRLCGMVSLGDLAAREETTYDAADALTDISSNVSVRE